MSMMNWFDLVRVTGIDAKRLDPMTVHLLAGKILSDSVVTERKMKFLQDGVVKTGSAQKVVREMTEQERGELRKRIQSS
jgi:hypothetical protein